MEGGEPPASKDNIMGYNIINNCLEFYNLGLGDYIPFSSISGSGTGELLDEIVKHFDDDVDLEDRYDFGMSISEIGTELLGIR